MKYSEHKAQLKAEKEEKKALKKDDNKEFQNGVLKRTLITSAKNVFSNKKEYYSFFIALFIIQTLFWLLCISTATDIKNERSTVESLYDYDLLIENIDYSDYTAIINRMGVLVYEEADVCFTDYHVIPPDENTDTYGLKIKLKDGMTKESFIKSFIKPIELDENDYQITEMPIISTISQYIQRSIKNSIWLSVLLIILSSVLLMSLYSVRLNHYKFLYGIYMACGAGFKKLFDNAVIEMMIISLVITLPSFLTAVIICLILFGTAVSIPGWVIPCVIVINIAVVYISVRAQTRLIANKTPVSLIVANDNSNLVISPRKSFRIFNKSFPFHYELFSSWRFRKYLATTLASAVIFTTFFLCGTYISDMVKTNEINRDPAFVINVDVGSYDMTTDYVNDRLNITDVTYIMDEAMKDGLDVILGVKYTEWNNSVNASNINSHILLKSNNIVSGSKYTVVSQFTQEYDKASMQVEYRAIDEHSIKNLSDRYEISGDPYAVLNDRQKIIITDSISNEDSFDFKPGDKIAISSYLRGKIDKEKIVRLSLNGILKEYLTNPTFLFEDTEYEIAAVVHDIDGENNLIVGMNVGEYCTFTGINKLDTKIDIYLDDGTTEKQSNDILNDIRKGLKDYITLYYMDYKVERSFVCLDNELAISRKSDMYALVISVLLLLLSPVIWFFSQTMFYFKREKEITLLRMFGANEKKIRGVYLIAGMMSAITGFVVTVLIGLLCNYTLYSLFNGFLQKYGFIQGARYTFKVSVIGMLICVIVSMLCGFLSSFIPYLSNRKKLDGTVYENTQPIDG